MLSAIGCDERIGPKYLRSGLSFGGPCFPRDNRLVAYTARLHGKEAPLAEATDRVNEATKQALVERVLALAGQGDTVAVLGMAYRPNTYIVEESAGLYLAQHLKHSRRRVLVHDYEARPGNSPSLIEFENLDSPEVLRHHSPIKVVALCCPWPQYRSVELPSGVKIVDPWGLRQCG
jgi:UDPglucose 6-dehydrogenase